MNSILTSMCFYFEHLKSELSCRTYEAWLRSIGGSMRGGWRDQQDRCIHKQNTFAILSVVINQRINYTNYNMKDNSIPLYASPQLGQTVTSYAEQYSTALPKYISDYHAEISANREDSNYMSSVFQSQFNQFLVKSTGSKRGKWL